MMFYWFGIICNKTILFEHRNSGFTVIGWYKRGEISDVSNKENENDVDAGDIGYHIVSLYPTSHVVLNSDEFKNTKFDTNSIHL